MSFDQEKEPAPEAAGKPAVPSTMLVEWRKIADLSARIIGVPAALINRVHPEELVVLAASSGENNPIQNGDRFPLVDVFCRETARQRTMFHIPNAQHDPGWANAPVVASGLIAYLGFPIIWPDGEVFGTICVLDSKENAFAETYNELLQRFKSVIESHLQLLVEVTERRRAEEALRARTAELQALNDELDTFAHTVAHDLKAPLTTVAGYSAVLKEDLENISQEKLRQHLSAITQNTLRMGSIIDELLLLATVRKTDDLHMDPLPMASIVEGARERLAFVIASQEVEIITPGRWPTAWGYGPWVEAVWTNYISNAIKYGGRPPRIELGATPLPDNTVRFWVRDNGAGLTPQQQERLFTPFARLQKDSEGHGLGLSIVRRIVERLGGQVAVESHAGRGSTFSFTLPAWEE